MQQRIVSRPRFAARGWTLSILIAGLFGLSRWPDKRDQTDPAPNRQASVFAVRGGNWSVWSNGLSGLCGLSGTEKGDMLLT